MADTPTLAEALERLADEVAKSNLQTGELRREARDIAKSVGDLAAAVRANIDTQDKITLLQRGDINEFNDNLKAIVERLAGLDASIGVKETLAELPDDLAARLSPYRDQTGPHALLPAPDTQALVPAPPQGLRWNVGPLSIPVGRVGLFLVRYAIPGTFWGGAVTYLMEWLKHHVH